MNLETKLDGIASQMLDEAKKLTGKDRVEIFKAVSGWYLGMERGKKKKDPGESSDDSGTFERLRKKINGEKDFHA